MTIETKYNIGDEVFYLDENKVNKKKIEVIEFNLFKDGSGGLKYKLEGYNKEGNWQYLKENELFPTKEELLASL